MSAYLSDPRMGELIQHIEALQRKIRFIACAAAESQINKSRRKPRVACAATDDTVGITFDCIVIALMSEPLDELEAIHRIINASVIRNPNRPATNDRAAVTGVQANHPIPAH